MKKYTSVLIALVLLLIFGFAGCNSNGREYYPDIVIDLQNPGEKIIIKEWRFLMGSGAEVYYVKDSAKPVLLGKTTGGDDGFCPFNEGLYEVSQEDGTVTVKWCFQPSSPDRSNWKSKTFNLSSAAIGNK